MAYELVVAMNVVDEELYEKYRDGMKPILARYGGGFRHDYVVSRTLKTDADHPVTRVFAIYFEDQKSKDAFFADPAYLKVKETFWVPSVKGRTIIAEYER